MAATHRRVRTPFPERAGNLRPKRGATLKRRGVNVLKKRRIGGAGCCYRARRNSFYRAVRIPAPKHRASKRVRSKRSFSSPPQAHGRFGRNVIAAHYRGIFFV